MRKKREALATIPTDINKIYDKAIEKIRRQLRSRRELALRVLTWIKYASRPLKVEELQEAVAIEDGDKCIDHESLTDVDTIIEICAGLVIVDCSSGTIRFLHFTVEQYLRGRLDIFQRTHHPQYHLADICLTYLTFDWRSVESTDPLEPSSSVPMLIKSNVLLDYAVKYSHLHWNYYLSGAKDHACPISPIKFEEIIRNDRRRRKIIQIFFDREQKNKQMINTARPISYQKFGKCHAASVWGLDNLLNKFLWEDGTDLNALDDHGRTPLSFAVEYGWIEVTDILLAFQEIDINLADHHGRTPIWWGANTRSEQSLRLLLETPGIQLNVKDNRGITPLIRAAMIGANGCLRVLLDCPFVDPNSTDLDGRNSLYWACTSGKEETVKILLDDDGVYVDAEDFNGRTPLFAACQRGDENIVRMLLERQADVNRQSFTGKTPLHAAVSGGDKNLAVVKLLLDVGGINITAQDFSNQTSLFDARSFGHNQITQLLAEWEKQSGPRQSATGKALKIS